MIILISKEPSGEHLTREKLLNQKLPHQSMIQSVGEKRQECRSRLKCPSMDILESSDVEALFYQESYKVSQIA